MKDKEEVGYVKGRGKHLRFKDIMKQDAEHTRVWKRADNKMASLHTSALIDMWRLNAGD